MSDITEVLLKKGGKMTSKQTFVLALVTLLIAGYISYTGVTKISTANAAQTDRVVKSLDGLTMTVEVQNKNVLAEEEAIFVYSKTFKASMCDITRMAMVTISNNHIEDSSRQLQIYRNYTVALQNMYDYDFSYYHKFKCNKLRLSGVMDAINPMLIRDEILKIMFDSHLSHLQKRIDIERFLVNTATKFTELGKKYISKPYK